MSTRSSARNHFPPLNNSELTIRRRSRTDPTLLNNSKMTAEGNGDLLVHDLQTMEELCQPSLNGLGGPIALIAIQATNFRLKNDMIQQVQNSCQFHGLPGDDANKHLDKFLHVTQSIKVNRVTDDALHLYPFPHSLTHHAIAWFDLLPRNSINTFEQMAIMFLGKYFPPSMGASHGQNPPPAYQAPAYQAPVYQAPFHQPQIPLPQVVTTNEFTSFIKANDDILKNMQTNMTTLTNSNLELKNMFDQFMKMNTTSSSGTLPGKTITNPKEDLKGIKTQSGTAYHGPTIPTTSSLPLVVERKTEEIKDMVHPTNNGSTKDVQPLVVPTESPVQNYEPVIAPTIEPVASPFGPSIKSLLTNKDKLCELARTPLNENCSAVLLKKSPEKLGDLSKFLIPCDFPEMVECLALADLGASINLISLSVWNKLSLPDLSHTYMTLELVDRSISRSVGVAEDVFVKVGTFHFPSDFVVVDFDGDPRVPLILKRSFIKTGRALIDVFKANYNDITANRIDIIDMAFEEYSQDVLGFSDVIASGNLTRYYDIIVFTTSLTLTPFRNSDFLLEEVDAFLALEDDPTSPKVDQSYELKICKAKSDKSSIDEPLEVELKGLPPHLEYAFLEGDDKFPVIITKDFTVEEKTALISVLKSHKRAIAWKLFDIKGIDPKFCTHKILMEEDFEPAVQHQRRVNPKIHDVIKNEVLKLLDAGLIYPISDSPWVSPVHCVPKKGGFTVVENEENELIPTCLVTGWLVCIDYRKLNEARRKDHFPLPFMYQMLERLAGNQYYCFLMVSLVIGQRQEKHFRPIHYAIKTMTEAESNYTTTEKEMLAVVYAFEKFWSYLIMNKSIVYTDHSALKYLFAKKYSKARLIHWVLLLDRGTYFCNELFAKVMLKFSVTHRLATPYHPQTSGQVEKLVYGKACHLSNEVEYKAYWALKHANFDLQTVGDHRKVQLNELRDQAYKNSLINKEKTKRLHDSKIKDRVFNIGDRVLLFNSRLKIYSCKLKSYWNSWILKTYAKGFCPPVFTSSASIGNYISKSNRTDVYLLAYLINGLRFT
nr:reverse transcriptase domain-containing protein [Tanacetum cinerariifolium]